MSGKVADSVLLVIHWWRNGVISVEVKSLLTHLLNVVNLLPTRVVLPCRHSRSHPFKSTPRSVKIPLSVLVDVTFHLEHPR